MTYRVVFRPSAEDDLDRLYTFIRDDRSDPRIAISYIRRIRAYCEGFSTFPERGTKRDDIRAGLRIVGFERRVAIAFTISADAVVIGRIFYGGRNFQALLTESPDGFE
jgi:toxin ParE1/3/4